MTRGKKKDGVTEPQPEDVTPAVDGAARDAAARDDGWDGPTRAGDEGEIAELAAESARIDVEVAGEVVLETASPSEADQASEVAVEGDLPEPIVESLGRLESILESLLYAADRPLTVN